MKPELFDDEPLSDGELFVMFRDSFTSDKECKEAVRESQKVYLELTRQIIRMEMEEEDSDIDFFESDVA